jgi:hypothetical protein
MAEAFMAEACMPEAFMAEAFMPEACMAEAFTIGVSPAGGDFGVADLETTV